MRNLSKVPVLYVAAAVVVLAAGQCACLPQFQQLLPNGPVVDPRQGALGHSDGHNGGGPLNKFGEDFLAHGSVWSRALCEADSDGDGETNGEELGDPCCVWRQGGDEPPARSWQLGLPGNAEVKSGLPLRSKCAETGPAVDPGAFWGFYYNVGATGTRPRTLGSLLVDMVNLTLEVAKMLRGTVGFVGEVVVTVTTDQVDEEGRPLSLLRSTRELMSAILLVFTVAIVASPATWRAAKALPASGHLALLVLTALYIDVFSGVLHIVLDNPAFNTYPGLGPAARDFQSHHIQPYGITTKAWGAFLRDHHIVIVAAAGLNMAQLYKFPTLRIFFMWCVILAELMMAAHRWSHALPSETPVLVLWAQGAGFLISHQHHSLHHVSYDMNFAIFTGWSNPVLNTLVKIVHFTDTRWLWALVAWLLLPGISALPPVRTRIAAKARAVGTSLLHLPLGMVVRVVALGGAAVLSLACLGVYGLSLAGSHPVLMLAGAAAVVNGVVAVLEGAWDGSGGADKPRSKVSPLVLKRHLLWTAGGVAMMTAGVCAMVMNKLRNGTTIIPSTLHSQAGVVIYGALVVQTLSGLYKAGIISTPSLQQPSQYHKRSGIAIVAALCLATALSSTMPPGLSEWGPYLVAAAAGVAGWVHSQRTVRPVNGDVVPAANGVV